MVDKIKIPENYLEEIREAGREASKKGREVVYDLIGEYDPSDDTVIIEEMRNGGTKKGISTLGNIFDTARSLPRILYNSFKENQYVRRKREEGKEVGRVGYHSHPAVIGDGGMMATSWSPSDLWAIRVKQKIVNYPRAEILYRADIDEFEALNSDLQEIEIEPIKKE